MKKLTALIVLMGLAGCGDPQPIVSEFNGDSVNIITSSFSDRQQALAASTAEAQRICQKGSKKKAEHVSVRHNPNTYQNNDLFLCLN
ncbi:hypothetical protein [Ruegeria sp. ANG-S4]|uniref:hypothetical protein n=1 Tax=Ruegeria sp. ANG-S4 TaxID=1577904 RepID=UPI0012698EC8|nr:hypothetical protein [Ruegeria sp. ANG-S4]